MRTLSRIALYLLGALAVLAGSITPAVAADELGLSSDGVHWSGTLTHPLFDPAFRWVPGDSETRTFYVRNQSTDDGLLDLSLITGPAEDLIDTGDLSVGVKLDGGALTPVSTAGDHLLVSQIPVASGEQHRIDVQVDFDPASTNVSENKQVRLRFNVTLSQNSAVVQPPDGTGTGTGTGNGTGNGTGTATGNGTGNGIGSVSSNGLPGTGSTIRPWEILVAGGLIGSGLGLIGMARRRTGDGADR